jgi:hypothetical protein
MEKITSIALLFIALAINAQEKLVSYEGITHFEASIPFFEEVKATNEKTTCILITKTGDIACWINIKDFKFKRNLMEEHFNKNYMESNRYPRAVFKGTIENFDLKNLTSEFRPYQINGKMTIRGRTKKMIIKGTLKRVDNVVEIQSEFPLNTDDFRIEIPFIVRSKISKNVNTQIVCVLK